jgi:hypothetical protein
VTHRTPVRVNLRAPKNLGLIVLADVCLVGSLARQETGSGKEGEKAKNRLLTRAAQKRDPVFTCRY